MNTNTESEDINAVVVNNKFKNDGSFLEMFKQMQKSSQNVDTICNNNQNKDNITEEVTPNDAKSGDNDSKDETNETNRSTEETTNTTTDSVHKKSFININKRKIKSLKTGIIKKKRNEDMDNEESGEPTDAWNQYMREVRKYKEKYGDDNDKNRPLVK